jgi:hypothetical protein
MRNLSCKTLTALLRRPAAPQIAADESAKRLRLSRTPDVIIDHLSLCELRIGIQDHIEVTKSETLTFNIHVLFAGM